MAKRRPAGGTVDLERHGRVAVLRFSGKRTPNALGTDLVDSLVTSLEKLDRDPAVSVLVIAGDRRSFACSAWPEACLHALKGTRGGIDAMAPTVWEMLSSARAAQLARVGRLSKPVVAAVAGPALGEGCELALACDFIVAAQDARFGHPDIHSAIIPGSGGTQRLARAIGRARALEWILTGETFTGRQAFEWGLANRCVPPDQVLPAALELAQTLAARAPLAVRAAKEAVARALDGDLAAGLDLERKLSCMLFASDDLKEAMRARLDKRPPKFRGR